MERRYKEEDVLLILNYDTHGRCCLSLAERCLLHRLANDLHFDRPIQLSDELKGLMASKLTEINHRKFVYVQSHYTQDKESKQLLLIKTF